MLFSVTALERRILGCLALLIVLGLIGMAVL
jgi:hypothetical protein